jgi:M6 family metalloprotease-like protein
MPFPFRGERFTFTQPDGTELRVQGWGDQHHAVFETMDGFTVIRDPHTGFYCYAELSPDRTHYRSTGIRPGVRPPDSLGLEAGVQLSARAARRTARGLSRRFPGRRRWEERLEERRRATRRALGAGGPLLAPPGRGTVGEYVGLCLLIDFPDVRGSVTRGEVLSFCNQEGYNGFGNNGSVMDYFHDSSSGRLTYTNLVTNYHTARHPRAYYTDRAIPQPVRTWELIHEALDHLMDHGFDFSQLSTDGSGYVYALNVFYAGRRANNWAEGLWPHSYRLDNPAELGPGRVAFDYQITDMGDELSLATFCHENGHMICDFPDLYDYGYESAGIGDYCLMCGGGKDRRNPTGICAYLKYKAGWATKVTPLTDGLAAEAPASGNEFFIHAKSLTEYFLVENRFKADRDAGLPCSGLAIWHVDELGSNENEQMSPTRHYECALEQADDRHDLERGVNEGDQHDLHSAATRACFGDATSPRSRWWDGAPSGLEIADVSPPGEVMTFRVGGGGVETFNEVSAPERPIPDNDPTGLEDSITFDHTDGTVVTAVSVSVDITHPYRGDLRVSLVAPSGSTVVLHDRTGGRQDNLRQTFDFSTTFALKALAREPVEGTWRLRVQDLAPQDVGILKHWELDIQARRPTADDAVVILDDSPGVSIPDNTPAGITRTLHTDAGGVIREVSVDVDITHSFIRDLIVALVSPRSTRVDLHYRMGGSSNNIIATFDLQNTPHLADLAGEPVQGEWTLFVSDNESHDVGKLNRWRLSIYRG